MKSLGWIALLLLGVALFVQTGALVVAGFAMRPESDDASGVATLGTGFAMFLDLVSLVVAIVALVTGRRQQISSTMPIVALVLSLVGLLLSPLAWIVWILAFSPIGIH